MTPITDEYMKEMLKHTKDYSIVIMKSTGDLTKPGIGPVLREHARRNFRLRSEGVLPVVCPVTGDSEIVGVGIMTTTPDKAREIMEEDPCVLLGIFTFEVYPCKSFPGDTLP